MKKLVSCTNKHKGIVGCVCYRFVVHVSSVLPVDSLERKLLGQVWLSGSKFRISLCKPNKFNAYL